MDQWPKDVRASIKHVAFAEDCTCDANQLATEIFMRRERRRSQARHIWEKIEPDWPQTQGQEANANRRMQFKVGNYKDSNIRVLTGTIKADWIQLLVERYLHALL